MAPFRDAWEQMSLLCTTKIWKHEASVTYKYFILAYYSEFQYIAIQKIYCTNIFIVKFLETYVYEAISRWGYEMLEFEDHTV